MKAIAPAKVILTGEHAVVHGGPAILAAVDRYAMVETTTKSTKDVEISMQFPGESRNFRYSFPALSELASAIDDRYNRFLTGELPINDVLTNRFDLLPYAVSVPLRLNKIDLRNGLRITVKTDFPPGYGMGSSAAVSLAVIRSICYHHDIQVNDDALFEFGLKCENVCHGRPSGADPFACISGGIVRFEKDRRENLPAEISEFNLAFSGQPLSTTGECVAAVRKQFANSGIWDEFAATAEAFESALRLNNRDSIIDCTRRNHRLLQTIGVVPEMVGNFIDAVEAVGGGAKITGAGSIAGDAGGAVLIFADQDLTEPCQQFGYELTKVGVDKDGLRVV